VPVDLVFVLDSSASLGNANWVLVKTLAANIVEQFNIGESSTRYDKQPRACLSVCVLTTVLCVCVIL
jgi:hypothetical protein